VDTSVDPGALTIHRRRTRLPLGGLQSSRCCHASQQRQPATDRLERSGSTRRRRQRQRLRRRGGGNRKRLFVVADSDGPAAPAPADLLTTTSPWVKILVGEALPELPPGGRPPRQPCSAIGFASKRLRRAVRAEQSSSWASTGFPTWSIACWAARKSPPLEHVFAAPDPSAAHPGPGTLRSTSRLPTGVCAPPRGARRLDHGLARGRRAQTAPSDGTEVLLLPALRQHGLGFGRGALRPGGRVTTLRRTRHQPPGEQHNPFVGCRPAAPLSNPGRRELAGEWQLVVTDTTAEDSERSCVAARRRVRRAGVPLHLVNRSP